MIKPVAIDKDAEQHPSLNFGFLRSTGIALIQQMAGKSWTDYNLHDPGVTILEQLCYAITDLAYRTDFPIRDLLANEKGIIDYEKNSFFRKEDILTTNPVTINDYRKVIIDEIDEVENVWLYPVLSAYSKRALRGLYKIIVQVKREVAEELLSENKTDREIISLVRECFISRRNLCEDIIEEIVILKPVKITIEAEMLVSAQVMPEEVLAEIYHHLENSLNLPVRYFAEKEMLEKGFSIDEIYNGPFLKKGFIPDSELNDRKTLIDPTELIKTVSQVTGVLSVKKLRVINGQISKLNKPFKIDEFSFPLLDIRSSEQHIKLFKDNFEITIKRPVFRTLLQKIREAGDRSFISSFYNTSAGNNQIKGKYRNNEHYYSIQNQFPRIYGIGQEGLIADVPDRRKAQAKQLKGYLLFFEQIMANYLSQLANINESFSAAINKKGNNTYFQNPLYTVPDVKELLKAFTKISPTRSESDWELFKKDKNNEYIKALNAAVETDQTYSERKNRLLDHLLARFNEFVTPYPVQLYSTLYESHIADERAGTELKWKSNILKSIAKSGAGRVRAFNYLSSEQDESYDFAWKMKMLLHINENNHARQLTSVFDDQNIIVESADKKVIAAEGVHEDEADEVSWMGDMPRILIDKKEVSKLFEQGRIEDRDDLPRDAFILQHQEVSVLKYALDIKNFRIGPDQNSDYLVLYKAPLDEKWKVISRFVSHSSAMKSLKNLINYIRTISIKSEGFYIVEHILLRPDLNAKVFGFNFIAEDGQKLMEHSRWMSFREREEVISSLLHVVSDKNEITAEKLAPLCRITLYAPLSGKPELHKNDEGSSSMLSYIKAFAGQQDRFLSRMEMVVKGGSNEIVKENFFSLNMSVVFPSWPARFQDKNFREATENLFRLNTPAHIKVNFIWMNVSHLKKFEALYFDWKKFMIEDNRNETKNELRTALVQMLNKYQR